MRGARVSLAGLSRRYDEAGRNHVVLAGVDAEIPPGQFVVLVGRSGSGKSTLLNLIAGIDQPEAGNVLIHGLNLTAMSDRERTLFRRRHIGFVYQAFNLVPTLNVADNVRLMLELNGVPHKSATERVNEILQGVGLEARGNSYPEMLSGGEQQRVAIARALVHRPRLLLADEPTGNLDDRTAGTVLHLLQQLRHQHGATLVMATHSAAVAATCDRVYDLRGGQLLRVD